MHLLLKDGTGRVFHLSAGAFETALGLLTIAEEVDNEIVLETLKTLGVAYAQGMAVAPPQPLADPDGAVVLPPRWRDGKGNLDLATPFDFVSTADTIGGNSGSPVLNRAGELVGVNFDRNRHGLVRNFVYTDEQARHIAVHCRAVLEALRKLYDCQPLVAELTAK